MIKEKDFQINNIDLGINVEYAANDHIKLDAKYVLTSMGCCLTKGLQEIF